MFLLSNVGYFHLVAWLVVHRIKSLSSYSKSFILGGEFEPNIKLNLFLNVQQFYDVQRGGYSHEYHDFMHSYQDQIPEKLQKLIVVCFTQILENNKLFDTSKGNQILEVI